MSYNMAANSVKALQIIVGALWRQREWSLKEPWRCLTFLLDPTELDKESWCPGNPPKEHEVSNISGKLEEFISSAGLLVSSSHH